MKSIEDASNKGFSFFFGLINGLAHLIQELIRSTLIFRFGYRYKL